MHSAGVTPLMTACDAQLDKKLVRTLLKEKTCVQTIDVVDKRSRTALQHAISATNEVPGPGQHGDPVRASSCRACGSVDAPCCAWHPRRWPSRR